MCTSKSTHLYSMHASRMKLLRQEFSGRLSCLRNSQYWMSVQKWSNPNTEKDSRKPTALPVSSPIVLRLFSSFPRSELKFRHIWWSALCLVSCSILRLQRSMWANSMCQSLLLWPQQCEDRIHGTHPRQGGTGFASCQRPDKPWVHHSQSSNISLV